MARLQLRTRCSIVYPHAHTLKCKRRCGSSCPCVDGGLRYVKDVECMRLFQGAVQTTPLDDGYLVVSM